MPPADPWAFGVNHVVWLSVALLALIGVFITVRQKQRTDKRSELWGWISWALDRVTYGDELAREAGLNALQELVAAGATAEETSLPQQIQGTYVSPQAQRVKQGQPLLPAALSDYDKSRLLNIASIYRMDDGETVPVNGGQS